MKRNSKPFREAVGLLTLALGIVSVTPTDAWAYIDPGTGSYLFQLAAAGFLAGLYTVRRHWNALLHTVRSRVAALGRAMPVKSRE